MAVNALLNNDMDMLHVVHAPSFYNFKVLAMVSRRGTLTAIHVTNPALFGAEL